MSQFVELMQKIEGGAFSVSGKLAPIFPGIIIKNVGEISLPLAESQAEKIIEQCEQAPFGRGEETIIDTEVRNVWQISPEALEFTNPQWDAIIANACTDIAKQLGLSDSKVDFVLYKVLVYAKGSFFQEHRDTEKIPNMFATLVVNLPSTHAGGELIVRHGNESYQYSFAGKSKFYPEFAAFYADCYHEVKPISSGYRFSLIYNLAIANRKEQPLLSQQIEISDQVDAYIQKWSQNQSNNPFLVYLLDHSYSEQNLSVANLKGHDFAKTTLLFRSADKSHCKAFLCLVSYIEESYGDYWGGKYEECEITRQEVYAHHFINVNGEKINVESLILAEDQLLTDIPLRKGPGQEVSISEATGNEGATKELWYHRGAIILWPGTRDLDVALKTDIAYAIYYLKKLIHDHDVSEGEKRKEAILLAQHIVDSQKFQDPNEIIETLLILNDIEVLRRLIKNNLTRNLLSIDSRTIVHILDRFTWTLFENDFYEILKEQKRRFNIAKVLPWLRELLLEKPSSQEAYSLIAAWFQGIWKSVISHANGAKGTLSCIFQILSLLGKQQLTDEVLLAMQDYQQPLTMPFKYAPEILDAIEASKKGPHHLNTLKTIVENFLQRAQESYPLPPKAPINLARNGHIQCTCIFCEEINTLLPDPHRSSISFENTLQRNLHHIETKIAEHSLDLQIQINRQPPRFKGIITKNQSSYEQALKRFITIEQSRKDMELWMKLSAVECS